MKFKDMKELTPYRVINPSSDGTFGKDDIIWMSSNVDVNSCNGKGWIMSGECEPRTVDFEIEEADDYEILVNGSEICRKRSALGGM